MKKSLFTALCAAALLSAPTISLAENQNTKPNAQQETMSRAKQIHQKLKGMSKEERRQFHQQAKQKWDALTPEEQAAFKSKVADKLDKMRAKYEQRAIVRLYAAEMMRQEQRQEQQQPQN